jgi:hypothetical protein
MTNSFRADPPPSANAARGVASSLSDGELHNSRRRTIHCANCLIVVPNTMPPQRFCPECAAERERVRKRDHHALKRRYKRLPTPARARRYRPKKVSA